jgi:hypothetical protein
MNLDTSRRSKAGFADAQHPRLTQRHVCGAARPLRTRALCGVFGAAIMLVSGTLAAQAAPPAAPPPAEPKKPVSVEISDPPPPPGRSPLPDSAPLTGIPKQEPVEPEPEPPPPPPAVPAQPAETQLKLSVGGGMILFYYQPLQDPPGTNAKNFFEVFELRLRVDAEFGRWGMHLMPVIRDTKERAFFPSSAWVQEAYGYGKFGPVTVKAGKVWAQFGRFWDNSFYGNAQEFDGFKLDPNHGISIEGDIGPQERKGLVFFAQYFIIDGTTNYSLPGRDTLSIEGARRRNYLVGRVEPFIKLGDLTTLKLAASGGYFQADLPIMGKQNVARVAVDTTIMVQNFTAWGEYTHQFGNHLSASPFAGTDPLVPHDRADYAMVGAEYTYDRYTARYNFNMGSYKPIDYKETRHVPGIGVAVDRRMFIMLEYVMARRYNGGVSALLDHCLALTIHGKV